MFRNPTTDLIVVLVIVLLFFGPKRLPGLAKGLGQGIREFKDSIGSDSKDDDAERPELTRAQEAPVQAASTPTQPAPAPAAEPSVPAAPAPEPPAGAPESTEVGSAERSA
jgi:sec-independent protein translocase protein TatA